MVPDFKNMTVDDAEAWLREELQFVDLVGQLPLEEKDFISLCGLMQNWFLWKNQLLLPRIPPAIFVSSMVFSARFSNVNARQFWKPYFQTVWGREAHSQTEYNHLRGKFVKSASFLTDEYDLIFPQRSGGDVVRPIYRHAIIPFYLQDYFAEWIKSRWKEILLISPEELISQLRLETGYRYLPPTLKAFLESEETEETAQDLLVSLATASSMFSEGESPENIDQLLSSSPIHKALWHELLQVYQREGNTVKARKIIPVFEWVWSLEQHEMQLRVRNVEFSFSEKPDRIVWVHRGQNPGEANIDTRLLPWQTETGWLVDIAHIGPGPLDGRLVLLGINGSVLGDWPVPGLPINHPVTIFRFTQQNVYGVPVDLSSNLITDGMWLVSKSDQVKLTDSEGQELKPIESRPVPTPLETRGHQLAGTYELKLPLKIQVRGLVLADLEKKKLTGGKPSILGTESSTLPYLSDSVPPVFIQPQIWLHVPDVPAYVLRRGTLWLRNGASTSMYSISSLIARRHASLIDNVLQVALGELIEERVATFTVQIIIGLQNLFASPLQFAYLPGVKITPPDPIEIYSPKVLPVCTIEGLKRDDLMVRSDVNVKQREDGPLLIEWSDLRDDPHVNIQIQKERVSLAWKIQRVAGWLQPDSNVYSLDEFRTCELHVLSTARNVRSFTLRVDQNAPPRTIQLRANGTYSTRINVDPVLDLVREKPSPIVDLFLGIGPAEWMLCEIQKKISLETAELIVHSEGNQTQLEFRCGLEHPWLGQTEFLCNPVLEPAQIMILGSSDHLSSSHLFSGKLSDGFHEFQILHQGKKLLEVPIVFSIGLSSESKELDFVQLRPFLLDRSINSLLLSSLHHDFTRFIEYAFVKGDLYHYPDLLLRLFCLPYDALAAMERRFIEAKANELTGIFDARGQNLTGREDMLYPAWVVIDRPIIMRLILPVKHLSIKVFPILLRDMAKSGVGYTYLRVRGEESEPDPIYVKWDIQQDEEKYNLLLGLPDVIDKRKYEHIDEYDVWPLRQCWYCGYVMVTRRTAADEALHDQHKHERNKPALVDLTYGFDLIAQVTVSKVEEELRYLNSPRNWFPRHRLEEITGKRGVFGVHPAENPISPENYLQSMARVKVDVDNNEGEYIQEWLSVRTWQEAFTLLEELIKADRVTIPAFRASRRMLEVMQNEASFEWLKLDKQTLMFALILRGHAFHPNQITILLNQINLSRVDLVEMLELSSEFSPGLLRWGLAWAETLYLHALG